MRLVLRDVEVTDAQREVDGVDVVESADGSDARWASEEQRRERGQASAQSAVLRSGAVAARR